MKKILSILTLVLFLAPVNSFAQKKSGMKDSVVYTCPMHPSVKEQKAGKCPQCGMALVKEKKESFACPMHADVTSAKAGKCSKCGMELVKVNDKVYKCPMHETETSDKPGKCSKCGMALKEKKADD